MAGVTHHLVSGHCPSPMNLTAEISFGNDHAGVAHLQYNYGMAVRVYPQNISNLHILIIKFAGCVHACRQRTECLVTEYKGKSDTTHGTDIFPVKSSALPLVISRRIRIRLIVSPGRSLLIPVVILKGNHSLIDFLRCGNRTVTGDQLGYGFLCKSILLQGRGLLPCVCH